jgi:hypothetical protein
VSSDRSAQNRSDVKPDEVVQTPVGWHLCFDPEGKTRPTEFKSPPGSKNFVNVHKRVKS